MIFPAQRKIANRDSKGIQFGNFRYIFKQIPFSMFKENSYINEIYVSTCDDIYVTKLAFAINHARELYKDFVEIIRSKDSFYISLTPNCNNEASRIYGCYDFTTENYILEIEKEESYKGNKSIIRLVMDEEDFREFAFLFYFHFLIALSE